MTANDITKLILRTSLQDRTAFDQLYTHTSAKLFGVCLRILRNRAEAEDALQEVYVKIWTKADRFAASELSPITWLVAIARHHAIDRLRMRRPFASGIEPALDIPDGAPDPEMQVATVFQNEKIYNCLDELEEDRARAVRGAYLDGTSYADLAKQYNIPLNTMRTWLRRSLIKLKECLER